MDLDIVNVLRTVNDITILNKTYSNLKTDTTKSKIEENVFVVYS